MRRVGMVLPMVILLASWISPLWVPELYAQSVDWAKRYNGTGKGDDEASALAVDTQGNVYVTGYSTGVNSSADYTTIKYSAAGEPLWVKRYNGPGNDWDQARALTVDTQGNVYVTGVSVGVGATYDYATIKYSPGGERLWARRYGAQGGNYDGARDLALDSQGNAYVTGGSYGWDSYNDCATIKYGPSGEQLWVWRYNGPDNMDDYANALAVDAQGKVYVTGESIGVTSGFDYVTVKYSQK